MNKLIALIALIVWCNIELKAQEDGVIIDEVVAIVGSHVILKSDLESQIILLRGNGVLIDDNARCGLLEELLYAKLLIHQATIDSVTVSSAEVEGEIDRRMNYFVAQIGSEKKLEKYYKKSILEIREEVKDNVKNNLITQRMQATITSGVQVTPKEVKAFYNSLDPDSVPLIESEVEYAQILINAKESKVEKEAARARITEFRERIIEGEDFSTISILYSEDEGSAKKGGELGFMGRAELVPEFSVVAFKLKNKAVSEIIETQYGFHILELIERRGQKVNVRHILVKIKISQPQIEAAKNLADSISLLMEVDTITFEQMALQFSDDEKTKKSKGVVVNPQTGTSLFDIDQLNPQVYYSVDKMKSGEISSPVPAQSQDGKKGYRIIKLITKTEPHIATFESDYAKIQSAALANKQNEATMDWVKSRIGKTYLKIDEAYRDCVFENNWVK